MRKREADLYSFLPKMHQRCSSVGRPPITSLYTGRGCSKEKRMLHDFRAHSMTWLRLGSHGEHRRRCHVDAGPPCGVRHTHRTFLETAPSALSVSSESVAASACSATIAPTTLELTFLLTSLTSSSPSLSMAWMTFDDTVLTKDFCFLAVG